jgi:hypothetical protein
MELKLTKYKIWGLNCNRHKRKKKKRVGTTNEVGGRKENEIKNETLKTH